VPEAEAEVRARSLPRSPDSAAGGPAFGRASHAPARSIAEAIVRIQTAGGNRAAVSAMRMLQRQPTFGNLYPKDAPARGSERLIVRLEQVDGVWREIGIKYSHTARGLYDFVVRDGKLWAVKAKNTWRALGHTEAARGKRVEFAGQVEFEGGKVKRWNDGSGHFRPAPEFRDRAIKAGLPKDEPGRKFFNRHPDAVKRPRPPSERIGPQLPVEQPATHPRSPGEPPKIDSGPPRLRELERHYGSEARQVEKAAATETKFGRLTLRVGEILEGLLPGPQDALFLLFDLLAAMQVGHDAAVKRGTERGFANGFAAGLLGASETELQNLAPRVVNLTVESEVGGTTGVEERAETMALRRGYRWSYQFTPEQRRHLRLQAFDVLVREGWKAGLDDEDLCDQRNIEEIARVLRPQINELLAKARAGAAQRREREDYERRSAREVLTGGQHTI